MIKQLLVTCVLSGAFSFANINGTFTPTPIQSGSPLYSPVGVIDFMQLLLWRILCVKIKPTALTSCYIFYVMRQVTCHVLSTPNGNQHYFNPNTKLPRISHWYNEPVIPVSTYNIVNRMIQSVSNMLQPKEGNVHIGLRIHTTECDYKILYK